MEIKVTALIENTSQRPALSSEFGLSLFVEADGRRVLFDAGRSGAFMDNAAQLGIDLDALDAVALSHGHVDHCCGICRMVREGCLQTPLYVHREFFTDRWWDKTEIAGYLEPTSSGLDAAYLLRNSVQLRALSSPCFRLFPEQELYIISSFRRVHSFEPMDPTDLVFSNGGFHADDYRDELALVIKGTSGLALITGCAHNGLANLCTHAQRLFDMPVTAYIGGTHLAASPISRAEITAEYINQSEIRLLAACHCTGPAAKELFARSCPAYTPFSTGDTLTVEV